jgi:predicted small secreted protein
MWNCRFALSVVYFDVQRIFYLRRFIMIKKTFTSLLAALFMAGLFGSVAGCNTVEGAGKDIQAGGTAIKDEARENKKY